MTEVETMKVGTYNIFNASGGKNIDAIANQIRECGLDVIGFQEVDYYTSRCPYDTMKEFAARLGYYYAYFPTLNVHGGQYGIGTLSRWPIINTSVSEIDYKYEKRILSHCTIKTDSGYTFNFYNTHIDYGYSENIEDIQAASMQKIRNTMKEPYILTGDFNTRVEFQDKNLISYDMVAALTKTNNVETYPGGYCIDNVMASASDFSMLNGKTYINNLSDHYMVYSTVFLTPSIFQGRSPADLGDDVFVKLKNDKTGLDITTNSDEKNVFADKSVDDSHVSVWKLKRHANNVYTIYNVNIGLPLDVTLWGDSDGSVIQLCEDNGASAQRYLFYNFDGKYVIKPIYTITNQVVSVDEATNDVLTSTYNGSGTQLFSVFDIGFMGEAPLNLAEISCAYIKNVKTGLNLSASGADTIFVSETEGNLWQFVKEDYYLYKIKNVSSNKYLFAGDVKTEGNDICLSENGTNFRVYSLNGHLCIKPENCEFVCDMDANRLDMNLYGYGTTAQKTDAQQLDIIWISASDLSNAYLGESGEVYIQNYREDRYLSNINNYVFGIDGMTSLWKFEKNPDGSYSFIDKQTGLYMEVEGGLSSICSKITLSSKNGSPSQKFFIYMNEDGYFFIRPSYTGKVLDFAYDNYAQTYYFNRTNAQKFRMFKSDGELFESDASKLILKGGSEFVLSDNILKNVRINTTAEQLRSSFENKELLIFDENGNEVSENSVCASGFIVKTKNGSDWCVVSVIGDVDGDGIISSTDYLRIKSSFLGTFSLEGVFAIAADTYSDGEINATDYLRIKSHFIGEKDLADF